MPRLLFTKEGPAIWSSHLDLMRALMRSFRRAGIALKHSQGYSPHPELSILLPLSVGVESGCELADFTPDESCAVPAEEIAARLNPVLPAGIRALACYEGGQKPGRLAWLQARLRLCFPAGGPPLPETAEALRALFARAPLVVEKHGKKGPVELDIAPMLRAWSLRPGEGRSLVLEAVVAAQNPTLNPLLLVTAIERYLPESKPDLVQCRRIELYDAEGKPFR